MKCNWYIFLHELPYMDIHISGNDPFTCYLVHFMNVLVHWEISRSPLVTLKSPKLHKLFTFSPISNHIKVHITILSSALKKSYMWETNMQIILDIFGSFKIIVFLNYIWFKIMTTLQLCLGLKYIIGTCYPHC